MLLGTPKPEEIDGGRIGYLHPICSRYFMRHSCEWEDKRFHALHLTWDRT